MPKQDVYHIPAGAVHLERSLFFFFLHRQGGGLQLARSSLPSDDTWGRVVALCIATTARLRGVRHASQRTPLIRIISTMYTDIMGDDICKFSLR